jgi:hypothetical protein
MRRPPGRRTARLDLTACAEVLEQLDIGARRPGSAPAAHEAHPAPMKMDGPVSIH